jgi:hypothetical protein
MNLPIDTLMADWSGFFIAMAGAGAALAGLIVVAMSVTIKQILAYPTLPPRAAATISALVLIVIVSGLTLIPHQTAVWLGAEVTFAALLALIPHASLTYRLVTQNPPRPFSESFWKISAGGAQGLPFAIGGVLVLFGNTSGLDWIAVGMLLAIAYAMLNAWVLLVEIQR